MTYFLWIFLSAAVGFIVVLVYVDASPKEFAFKVARKLSRSPEEVQEELQDAPYRQRKGAAHRPVLLNLETSDGSGQACHPDVVYIPGGFGSGKWPYWMACTPYPYGENHRENPELFVSRDGITWTVPEGLQNPLVPSPVRRGDHHSDPDMLFHENELWLYYRLTVRSQKPGETPDENKLFLIKSQDGVRWSEPVEILRENLGSLLLSPAVIHDGSQFLMWIVEQEGSELKLVLRKSADGELWSEAKATRLLELPKDRMPWHIDVFKEKQMLSAVFVTCTSLRAADCRLQYAYSADGGLSWRFGGYLMEKSYEFERKLQYRASLLKRSSDLEVYDLWYSACNFSNMFSIAYQRLVREGNDLIPQKVQPLEAEAFLLAK